MTDYHDEHGIYGDPESDEYHKMFGIPILPVDPYKESDSFKARKREFERTWPTERWIIIPLYGGIAIFVLLKLFDKI